MTRETYQPGDLLLGIYPVQTRKITLEAAAGELARGTVLGRVTASGEYKTALSASADGSEVPACILATDADASGGATSGIGYFSGGFDASRLTLGSGITVADADAAFAAEGTPIFLKELV